MASINGSFTRFVSMANLHEGQGQELSNTMKPGVTKALRKYFDVNGCLPERVFMFRLAFFYDLDHLLLSSI